MMMLTLDPRRYHFRCFPVAARLSKSAPFLLNKRGVLVHRPRSVVILDSMRDRAIGSNHYAITMHCGMPVNGRPDKLSFTDALDPGAIVCRRCEELAVQAGKPTSSDICQRHVCVGGVKAYSACCEVAS